MSVFQLTLQTASVINLNPLRGKGQIIAFLTVKEEDVKAAEAGSYIQTSGIYPLNLKHGQVVKTVNGATQLNYFFDKFYRFGS